MEHFEKATYYNKEMVDYLKGAPYIIVRPVIEGDYTITAAYDTADEWQLSVGRTDTPPHLLAKFSDSKSAMKCAYDIIQAQPHTTIWYDGDETYDELTPPNRKSNNLRDWLAYLLVENDGNEDYIEEFRLGNLTINDSEIVELIDEAWYYRVALGITKSKKKRRPLSSM